MYNISKSAPHSEKSAGLTLLTIKVIPVIVQVLSTFGVGIIDFLLRIRELNDDRHVVSETLVSVVVAEVALGLDLNRS